MVHHRFFVGTKTSTLIFLNGMPSDFLVWGAIALHFKKMGFPILLHNYRGQKNSPPLAMQDDMSTQFKDLRQLMEHYKIKKAHLIGASYGGQLALLALLKEKTNWQSLSLLSTYALLDNALLKRFHHWQKLLQQGGEHYIRSLAPSFYSEHYLQNNPQICDRLVQEVSWEGFCEGQKAMLQILKKSDPALLPLETIQIPTLALYGQEDPLTPPYHGELLKRRIPHCHMEVIPQASHALTLEAYWTIVTKLEKQFQV